MGKREGVEGGERETERDRETERERDTDRAYHSKSNEYTTQSEKKQDFNARTMGKVGQGNS